MRRPDEVVIPKTLPTAAQWVRGQRRATAPPWARLSGSIPSSRSPNGVHVDVQHPAGLLGLFGHAVGVQQLDDLSLVDQHAPTPLIVCDPAAHCSVGGPAHMSPPEASAGGSTPPGPPRNSLRRAGSASCPAQIFITQPQPAAMERQQILDEPQQTIARAAARRTSPDFSTVILLPYHIPGVRCGTAGSGHEDLDGHGRPLALADPQPNIGLAADSKDLKVRLEAKSSQ
jgi:hypothetical protein